MLMRVSEPGWSRPAVRMARSVSCFIVRSLTSACVQLFGFGRFLLVLTLFSTSFCNSSKTAKPLCFRPFSLFFMAFIATNVAALERWRPHLCRRACPRTVASGTLHWAAICGVVAPRMYMASRAVQSYLGFGPIMGLSMRVLAGRGNT